MTRVLQLDALRGLAVLGILVMNIQGFSSPGADYINPLGTGPLTTAEWVVWWFGRVVVDYKFIGIFSLLFGAGIGFLADQVMKGDGNPAVTHYRRMLALLVIGAVHALVLWYGDILVTYALIGLLIFPLRRLPAQLLILLGLAALTPGILHFLDSQASMASATREAQLSMAGMFWTPDQATIDGEIAAMTGTLGEQFAARWQSLNFMLTWLLPNENLWKSGGLMLLGLGLYRSGFFFGRWTRAQYGWLAAVGIVTGLAIQAYGLAGDVRSGFDIAYSLNTGRLYLYVSSVPQAIGYAALFYWVFYTGRENAVLTRLAMTGRMALSNYLMQSVICCFIFYGWGLGFYGQFDRVAQFGVVLLVWAMQLIWSPIWLRSFAYGPVEWLWRWAGKGKRPAFRRHSAS